jgi:hypothetical protein
MEIAHVVVDGSTLLAEGTQLGPVYELRYRLDSSLPHLEVVREPSTARTFSRDFVTVELGDADFFDLGWSPLFNSLPVLRDGLLAPAAQRRDYVMRWVDVPSLEVSESHQSYEPIGNDLVRFRADDFVADIHFDADGFVIDYPGIAHRVADD